MDTTQINCLATSDSKIQKIYWGCFPSNFLPKRKITIKTLPVLLCCNLCTTKQSDDMCHWIGIFITKNTVVLFDSGGAENWSSNQNVKRFIRNQDKAVVYNEKQYQPMLSDKCGLYVLCFFYSMSRKKSFRNFLKDFSESNLMENDVFVWKRFKNTFLRKKTCKNI